MIDEKRIESLIREILVQMAQQEGQFKARQGEKKILGVAFSQGQEEYIRKNYSHQYEFVPFMPEKTNYGEIWIGNLEIEDIFTLESGFTLSQGKLISQLAQGKRIVLDWDPSKISKGNLYLKKRVEDSLDRVERMGFILKNLTSSDPIGAEVVGKKSLQARPKKELVQQREDGGKEEGPEMDFQNNPQNYRLEKKVITEADIKKLPQLVQVLEISTGSILTPLAKDLLQERNILWVKLF